MKLNPVGSNQTEVERDGGITILYSVATSRHVNKAVERWGATRTDVDQGVIDQLAA